jgi:adenylylsulfate kinase
MGQTAMLDQTHQLPVIAVDCASTLWLTGLSAAGKSTLAYALQRSLLKAGRACYVLDGDQVRLGLNRDLGFSTAARTENIRRVAEVARLMNDAGLIVICALISPRRADRSLAKSIIGASQFKEIYVNTPLAVCAARDPKGLYAKAQLGLIAEFSGVSAVYEAPLVADLLIDTVDTAQGADLVSVQQLEAMLRLLPSTQL